ncbi:MAG: DUF2281 domain-containing protein [Moheibacter sp.]
MEAFGKANLYKKIEQLPDSMMGELSEYVEFLLHKCGSNLNRSDEEAYRKFREWRKNNNDIVDFSNQKPE